MDISELGRLGLIKKLTANFETSIPSTIKGIGDDAAIINCGDTNIAIATDTLMEGIHFDLTYFPLQHLGYKAAIAGFSNIYAMNAKPSQMLVSIAVSAKFSVEALERLYQGIKLACESHNVDMVGGDTVPSMTGLAITITAVGMVEKEKITFRNTAKNGDLLCLSGNLGAAYMGLQTLEREKKLFDDDPKFIPQLEAYSYVVGRHLKPEARKDIVEFLISAGLQPTSMIDVSAGLSPDLLHICSVSGVGCEIHHHKIPIAAQTVEAAEEFHLEPLVVAMNGGDDFELLFTLPVADYDKIALYDKISIIGYITASDKGCNLVTETGSKIEIK